MNEQKQNYGIHINLLKLRNAFMRNFTGKTTTKRCIVIPVDDNPEMFLGEKGCYINFTAFEVTNSQYGDSHLVKGDLPKEKREKMTQEERDAMPILGNMRPIARSSMPVTGYATMTDTEGQDDDLPF